MIIPEKSPEFFFLKAWCNKQKKASSLNWNCFSFNNFFIDIKHITDHNRSIDAATQLFPGRTSLDVIFGRPNQLLSDWEVELGQVRLVPEILSNDLMETLPE